MGFVGGKRGEGMSLQDDGTASRAPERNRAPSTFFFPSSPTSLLGLMWVEAGTPGPARPPSFILGRHSKSQGRVFSPVAMTAPRVPSAPIIPVLF